MSYYFFEEQTHWMFYPLKELAKCTRIWQRAAIPTPVHVMLCAAFFMCPQLLSKPKFSGVEKIKTIGSTYMAATGLNVTLGPECAQACFYSIYMHLFAHTDTLHDLHTSHVL